MFLIHRWPVGSHEAIAQLMTDYHRSGHLRLDIPLPSFRTTGMRGDRTKEPGFLEASILSGHVQAMHALLELGATYDGDMLELIEEQTQLVNQGPLRAAATQWLVKRALAGEVGQAAVSARRAQAPRRAAL